MLKTISAALAAITLIACPVHAQVAAGSTAAKLTVSGPVDWTPMFKSWERGCEFTSELSALVKGMAERRVVLPPAYQAAAGKISRRKIKGYDFIRLPIQGTYYDLAVSAFEFYSMPGTDDSGFQLILSASNQDIKKLLSRIKYKKLNTEMGEKQAQILLDGQDRGVFCY